MNQLSHFLPNNNFLSVNWSTNHFTIFKKNKKNKIAPPEFKAFLLTFSFSVLLLKCKIVLISDIWLKLLTEGRFDHKHGRHSGQLIVTTWFGVSINMMHCETAPSTSWLYFEITSRKYDYIWLFVTWQWSVVDSRSSSTVRREERWRESWPAESSYKPERRTADEEEITMFDPE